MRNDRFKFRVYDNVNKRYDPYRILIDNEGYICLEDGRRYCNGEHQEDLTIEQCTGLKDKNGKLIYEGDVIRLVEDGQLKHTAIVKWACADSGGWICESTTERTSDGRSKRAWFFTSAWEIICNIHKVNE